MALSKQLFPTWITVIPNIFCNVSSHILIYKCVTIHMPYLIQTACDGCGQCVYLEHSPICHSLPLLSLSGPLPAAAGAAGGRHNLRRLLSLNHRDPSSRHPPPSPPSHQHGHSTFYIYTGTFKQVVLKYSDMILLFVQCENVPTGVVCMYLYQHCTY